MRKGRDGALDLGGIAQVDRAHVHADPRRRRLDHRELADPGRVGGITKDRCPRHAWRDLLEQFQPFAAQTVFQHQKAGRVAARPRQTFDEPGADRIRDNCEYDRYGAGRLQQRPKTLADSQDNVRRKRDQLLRVFAYVGGIARAKAEIDVQVAAVGPTQLLQSLHEGGVVRLSDRIVRSQALKQTDAPHALVLLSARDKRPGDCRASKRGYKLSPSDADCHLPAPLGSRPL